MGSCISEQEDQFFDTLDFITCVSDSGSDLADNLDCDLRVSDFATCSYGYDVWSENPASICERRRKFLKWMGLSSDRPAGKDCEHVSCHELEVETDRVMECSGAVWSSSGFDDEFLSSHSSSSCWSNDARESLGGLEGSLVRSIRNLDDGTKFIVDELGQDGLLSRLREVSSNRMVSAEEFERTLGLSPLVLQVMRKEVENVCTSNDENRQVKKGWLRRLGAAACIGNRQAEAGGLEMINSQSIAGVRTQMVRVHSCRKRSKELSALYMGQDILAHEGSILTMKFSTDGHCLASGGEDGIVRVWLVIESDRSDELNIPDVDASYFYFTENHLSEIVPFCFEKEKKGKLKSFWRSSDSSCVIFPQKVFRILEKPIYEYHGHDGEVLDLSWSKNKYLLSSSADKTVRLWRIGCNQCLKVFSHNNYVTCIQFNPVDDNYFISGSIDGKVRIWAISICQVVDWTDITEIVTAVCYRPDGKGGIVGSMSGNCRFYDASDNRLQQYGQICLQSKKKSSLRRITGFQFCPSDPSKLIVTSADSKVRVLHGVDVISKYRGPRNAGGQISAMFTSDGLYIVSASEDSNVYVWNCISQDGPASGQVKNNWSSERFFSNNVSVAIPWCGMTHGNSIFSKISGTLPSSKLSLNLWRHATENGPQQYNSGENSCNPFSSPDSFSRGHGFFSESSSKVSATWPEEKLPTPSSLFISSTICKSQYKFLRASCQNLFGSRHAWGLVIVTAGWDGRIRSFQNYGLPTRF